MESNISFSLYQELSSRTMPTKDGSLVKSDLQKCIFGLGLSGEAGETVEMIKKHIGHGHPLDREKLKKELGDDLWYIAALCTVFDISMAEVAQMNIDKLKARYPEGFTTTASIGRKDQ